MKHCSRLGSGLLFSVLLCTAFFYNIAKADTTDEKLKTTTDYLPKATLPRDQLVEVAQRFKIPMAIEWVENTETTSAIKTEPKKREVRELIEEIASVLPEPRVVVEDGIVRVYSASAALHPFNFLNIVLDSYAIQNDHLFAADDALRWAIRFTLYPQKYRNGYAGGYGYGSPEVFQIRNLTISCSDITIRDVLNRIALAQGNALWVAEIKSSDLEGHEPFWKRRKASKDEIITTRWHFFPLAELQELAKEELVVDLKIVDVDERRVSTVPLLLEHGLTGFGGNLSVSSSTGNRYEYAASVVKITKDSVTLTIHLSVERSGEADFKFDGNLTVTRGHVTELNPEPRITIKGYLEAKADGSSFH